MTDHVATRRTLIYSL